jgi:hypothetical protein
MQTLCRAGLQTVFDDQFQALQFLDSEQIGPPHFQFGAQFPVQLLVELHQSEC